ncbi:MAG: gas vesicle protein K [Euryarchaeota archaeon CG01_land_8_20_14_3_00_38_12]|nr:MAG: gas vesicle protein K [Euryarchaeota archaeon CG01_land_8_20_14_3_00_38_12]PJB21524.1 MAG: gas vesicle protein K [Euryarchaeota archaeon CG_4_9_14_3_um_filter_38_12]
MSIKVDEDNWRKAILGLVLALAEIIRDAIQIQGMKRMEKGSLTDEEIERFGSALMELNNALEHIKKEQDIVKVVKQVRDGLDDVVDDAVNKIANPERWAEEFEKQVEKAGI